MGKRSNFAKRARDYYATPLDPIKPLVGYLLGQTYAELCVGGGDLVSGISLLTFRLADKPTCGFASDIQPDTKRLAANVPTLKYTRRNALTITPRDLTGIDCIVTNPPFSWNVLSRLLPVWLNLKPTWLLLPSDMANNVRFSKFMCHCSDILPVGRVSWMDNGQSGMENYSWYLFDASWNAGYARLRPR